MLPREPFQCPHLTGGHRVIDRGASIRCHRRTRPVEGQDEFVGNAAQSLGPVSDLFGAQRFRIVGRAEGSPLPECVVGVLDR